MPLTPEQQQQGGEAVKRVPVLEHCFGGTLCNQIVKEEPAAGTSTGTSTGTSDNLRESSEPFVCISLDVKGCSDLQSSLQKFVAGESFSDYCWEPGEPRVTITKRQCILNDKLPLAMIFHLKRFEFNLDTFLREKVNDEFSFPVHTPLDAFPYTKEGLQQAGGGDGGGGDDDDGGGRKSNSRGESYLYMLGAVVVHTGERMR
jgi:hypothetical protein